MTTNPLRFLAAVAFLLIVSSGFAQTTFTLDQCTEYALQNSIAAKNATLDEQIAESKVKETFGIGLPQITGNASVTHNQQLPRFFATKQTAFAFSGLPADDYPNFLPGLGDNDVVASQNFFQLRSAGDAGLSINQLIFNGSYIVGLQASKAYKELAYKSNDQTKEQIIEQVTKAYYTVLINKERTELFTSNIARVDTLLKNTRALFENGFAEDIDVDRIQVTLNNLLAQRDRFLSMNQLSIELLKFQMNYPMDQPLEVAGSIQDVEVNTDLNSYIENWDYKRRADYRVLEANHTLQSLNVRNKYAEGMPSLSASANLGYATQSPNVGGIFQTRSNFADNGTIGPDKWYGYSLFSVSLNVPIFSGLQRSYRIQQEKIALNKIENSFVQLKSSIDYETKQSTLEFENALQTLRVQNQTMELAAKVARVTKIKYEQGIGSNLEVIDAEDSLRQAQTNYYSSLFDAMIAKVNLDKAYGKLYTAKN